MICGSSGPKLILRAQSAMAGYEIYKPGFWTQGPVMLQALAILEAYDLRAMSHNSPEYLHTVVEAVKLTFADRDRHYGDPKFSKIPEQSSPVPRIRPAAPDANQSDVRFMEIRPGTMDNTAPVSSGSSAKLGTVVQDTTCVNVVDRKGNFFSATPSGAWLPSVIAGETGIPLSTRLNLSSCRTDTPISSRRESVLGLR